MKRTASAQWNGTVPTGNGSLTTQSLTLNETPYSFRSRFADGTETNPEELIAVAHAGCFSMALSLFLEKAGFAAETIRTKAELTLDPQALAITAIHLSVSGTVPGIDDATFQQIATQAKDNCPVSKVLRAEITLSVVLDN